MKRVETITVDGAAGEGGGQILRTSLALSLVTGKPVRVTNIRAGRSKPGLLRQHLTAVRAAVEVGHAVTDGAEIGSRELVFRPEGIHAGDYRFAVGTAGSTTLVLQTVLPALLLAKEASHIALEGGTHNPFAPPADFLTRVYLHHLAGFATFSAELTRPGFYPAGGGRLSVSITPRARKERFELLERGADVGREVIAHVAGLPRDIAERAFAQFEKRLGWPRAVCEIREHPAECGPGFVIVAGVVSERITEIFTGFGEKGVRAEQVADAAIDQVRAYLACSAPVGEYLADQLLLPLAIGGGGVFLSKGLSRHAQTNLDVIAQFLPAPIEVTPVEGGVRVTVAPLSAA